MRARQVGDAAGQFTAAQPFAARNQRGGKQPTKRDPRTRPDQALLDRILDQEDAAERQRQPADPHHPARAEQLLQAAAARRLGRGRRSGWPAAVTATALSGAGAAGGPAAWLLGLGMRRCRRRAAAASAKRRAGPRPCRVHAPAVGRRAERIDLGRQRCQTRLERLKRDRSCARSRRIRSIDTRPTTTATIRTSQVSMRPVPPARPSSSPIAVRTTRAPCREFRPVASARHPPNSAAEHTTPRPSGALAPSDAKSPAEGGALQAFPLQRFGAVEKTRTSTGCPTATSTLRVYQFRHDRRKSGSM